MKPWGYYVLAVVAMIVALGVSDALPPQSTSCRNAVCSTSGSIVPAIVVLAVAAAIAVTLIVLGVRRRTHMSER